MRLRESPATILAVDDDDVLLQVLSRVLTRAGHTVTSAADVAQALESARRHPPDLALLDLALPDGDGLELGRQLRSNRPDLPLILLTAYPQRLQENPDLAQPFARVLTKPTDLDELRDAVSKALVEKPMPLPSTPSGTVVHEPATGSGAAFQEPHRSYTAPAAAEPAHSRSTLSWIMSAAGVIAVVVVLVLFLAFVAEVPILTRAFGGTQEDQVEPEKKPGLPAVEFVRGKQHTLLLPLEVRDSLGIRRAGVDVTATAKPPTQSRPLVMPGSTMIDPARIMRIRVRYSPADVKEIGQVRDEEQSLVKGQSVYRELRTGDRVQAGDLLAVLYSTDLGQKKNDLIDAMVALKLDQDILAETKKAYDKGAVPPIQVATAERNVEGDWSLARRALNTMRTWNIDEKDIQAAQDEAKKISELKSERDKEKEKLWPRAELRVPGDGVIIERNVGAPGETWVDNTANLFQIAKVDRLLVVANCPEDDLPTLVDLQKRHPELMKWTVRTVGLRSPLTLSGAISEIGYLIDPNQHTAVIKGYIDNPGEQIRGTQFVSCEVKLPPPDDVVEIPVDCLIDDGKQSLVFVQTDAAKHHYTMRRVQVTQRFERTVFVRSSPIPKEEQLTPAEAEEGLLPKEALKSGEHLLQSGAGELKSALLNLESEPEKETKGDKR
jgi:cobalt-zinc-cadmium efflux system membrane fusion protein